MKGACKCVIVTDLHQSEWAPGSVEVGSDHTSYCGRPGSRVGRGGRGGGGGFGGPGL